MARLEDLKNVHKEGQCAGEYCCIHNPSDHHLKDAELSFRTDRGYLMAERICEHGIGHPDPDWLDYFKSSIVEWERFAPEVHGCDGCCMGVGLGQRRK